MTSTGQVFSRMIAYGLLLGVLNAVGGRLLHAALDPSVVLSLGATAWATYRLAEARRTRIAFPAGIVLWLAFIAGFVGCAYLLIGWNGSTPWRPRSTMWMVEFAIAVPIVALAAQFLGARAAARAAATRPDDMAPNA